MPTNPARSRLIPALTLGILATLSIAACSPSNIGTGSAVAPVASQEPAAQASADVTADIKVLDFKLEPSTVTVTGSTLALAVSNAGPTIHNVTVRDANGNVLFGTRDLRAGESETVTHTLPPGTYILFCSLPGHESLGVKGTLTVTAP